MALLAVKFNAPPLKLGSPVELRKVGTFGLLFLRIQRAGTTTVGRVRLIVASLLGGLASSASAATAVGTLPAHASVTPHQTATGTRF